MVNWGIVTDLWQLYYYFRSGKREYNNYFLASPTPKPKNRGDYVVSRKNHGNSMGILLKSRIFYFFNLVFLQSLSHSLRVLLQKVCENIGDVFCGIPVSKLK